MLELVLVLVLLPVEGMLLLVLAGRQHLQELEKQAPVEVAYLAVALTVAECVTLLAFWV